MRKRLLSIVLVGVMLMSTACGGSGASKDEKAYKKAVKTIQTSELKLDGSHEMNEHIITALDTANYKKPKNIIMMIGDGMGFNILDATEVTYAEELYEGTLAMRQLPVQSTQTTYSATHEVTDSGAGATALATGCKTRNYRIAVDATETETFKSVLEIAAEKGKSTGVIATKSVTDATPADFTAHVSDRQMHEEIAVQQLDKLVDGTLDLALGSGRAYFESETNASKLEEAKKNGVNYATKWDETLDMQLPVLGLYSTELLMDTTDEAMPTISEMTDYALKQLSQDEDGFFLMVEGSQIDSWGEKNVIDRQMKEAYDFDCAVAVAMRFVALNPDTVLIITADHETGDLELPEELTPESIMEEHAYHTTSHSYKTVPVYAAGYRTNELLGVHENTDIGIFVASLLGVKEFGHTSTTYTVDKKTTSISFDEATTEFVIEATVYADIAEQAEYLRTFHVKVKNTSDKRMPLPKLCFEHMGDAYSIKPQDDYIEAGETVELSYVFPEICWPLKQLKNIPKLVLAFDNVVEGTFEFSNIRVTERRGGK